MAKNRGRLALVKVKPAASADGPAEARKAAPAQARARAPAAVAGQDASFMPDSYASTAFAEIVDRSVHAATARFTSGLSPIALASAYLDWASHLAFAPGKRSQLAEKAFKKSLRFANYLGRYALRQDIDPCIVPLPQDKRFVDPDWQRPPFNLIYQSFLLTQQWWHNAVTGVRGVTRSHENIVAFATRQILDMYSPSNSLFTNPEVLRQTRQQSGMNLVRGAQNFIEDWE